jgi:hypothetical protein
VRGAPREHIHARSPVDTCLVVAGRQLALCVAQRRLAPLKLSRELCRALGMPLLVLLVRREPQPAPPQLLRQQIAASTTRAVRRLSERSRAAQPHRSLLSVASCCRMRCSARRSSSLSSLSKRVLMPSAVASARRACDCDSAAAPWPPAIIDAPIAAAERSPVSSASISSTRRFKVVASSVARAIVDVSVRWANTHARTRTHTHTHTHTCTSAIARTRRPACASREGGVPRGALRSAPCEPLTRTVPMRRTHCASAAAAAEACCCVSRCDATADAAAAAAAAPAPPCRPRRTPTAAAASRGSCPHCSTASHAAPQRHRHRCPGWRCCSSRNTLTHSHSLTQAPSAPCESTARARAKIRTCTNR